MSTHTLLRCPQGLMILLGFFLITTTCGLPVVSISITPSSTPDNSNTVPTQALPTATSPAAATQVEVPTATASETAAPVQTPTSPPIQLSEVTIYFVAVGDDGASGPKIGCGDSLVAVRQPIEPTSGVIRAALNKLFSYKEQDIGQSGLYNALWQSDLEIDSAEVKDGVATIYLTGQTMMGGECDIPRYKGQIEQTILAQPGVKDAVIYLNGKPIDEALSLK